MESIKSTGDENRIIKEFELDKTKKALVHPYFRERTQYGEGIDIYLVTIGHLWIYLLIEKHGFGSYLNDLVKYSLKTKSSLLEWEISNDIEQELNSILSKYDLAFQRSLSSDFKIMKYKDVLEKSKDKNHPYHQITRMLFLSKYNQLMAILNESDLSEDFNSLIEAKGSVINAAYLGLEYTNKLSGNAIVEIPESLIELISRNMQCHVEYNELKYYPKIFVFVEKLSTIEKELSANWYLIPDDEQVIISKLLYSFRLISELSYSLIGINGILSTFVTRTLFDNFWQSKYLIINNKISDYRTFALDRMRLHILKRSDVPDVSSINDLLSEVEGGVFDPIPINGDYFTKSAREYSIELGLKDEYDKYYEYNSEFIHASLTAVYSGLMKQCDNPEHNRHLTIYSGSSSYINSAKHIFEIANMHIDLVNDFLHQKLVEPLDINEFFFKSRDEFASTMSELM